MNIVSWLTFHCILFLISANVLANPVCNNYLEKKLSIPEDYIVAPVVESSKAPPLVRMSSDFAASAEYEELLNNSLEFFYSPSGVFGHVSLRVGKKLYSFNFIQDTSIHDFRIPWSNRNGKKGVVFSISPERLKEVQKEIDEIYANSAKYNVPPFDAYGGKLKILHKKKFWGLQKYLVYESRGPDKSYANNGKIFAKLIEKDGEHFLEAPNGFRWAVEKKGDEFFVQSYSCASSAMMIAEKFFGISFPRKTAAAKDLINILEKGNLKGTIPDLLIDYSP